MRTTIDLPDELFRRAKIRAAQDGIRLKELIPRCLEIGLGFRHAPAGRQARRLSELPVARAATGKELPSLSNAQIQGTLDEEDAARACFH